MHIYTEQGLIYLRMIFFYIYLHSTTHLMTARNSQGEKSNILKNKNKCQPLGLHRLLSYFLGVLKINLITTKVPFKGKIIFFKAPYYIYTKIL